METGRVITRGPLLLGTLWVTAASVATGVGLVAVDLVAGQVGDTVSAPLSQSGILDALSRVPASSPTPSPSPSRSASPSPSASTLVLGPLRTISTVGGEVSARCRDGVPTLLYATPAEGFRTERSSGREVRFESSRREVRVKLSCSARGTLLSEVETEVEPVQTRSPRPSPSETDESESPEPRDDDESDSPEPDESDGDNSGPG